MERHDVVIIGAGPAGSCCAQKLAQAGLSVMVYDRRQELGVPVRCGEGISFATEQLIGKIPPRAIAQRIKGARLIAPDGSSIDIEYGENAGYVLERKIFDKWLAERAAAAGAKLQTGTLISELISSSGAVTGVRGQFLGGRFSTSAMLTIAATGAESPLPKQAGIDTTCKLSLIDTCLQYEMTGIELPDPHLIYLYFGNKIAPRGYCVTPDTEVFTKNTVKAISDIKIGEEVLTMNGWMPVSGTSVRDYDGMIISITPFMHNKEVKLTPDHLIYIWNKKHGFQWKRAEDIIKGERGKHRNGDYLIFPLPEEPKRDYIFVKKYFKGIVDRNLIYPIGRNQFGATFKYKHGIPNKFELSNDLLEFFGYFISEGNVNSSGIIISNTNKEIVRRVKELGKKLFGFEPYLWIDRRERDKECVQVQFSSRILKELFASLFGIRCEDKRLPHFFAGLDNDKKISLLKGLFKGDGGKWKSTDGYDVLEYGSRSRSLIYDLWLLLAGMGIIGAISKNKKKNSYRIRIRGEQVNRLKNPLGKCETGRRGNRGFFIRNNLIFLGVRKIEKKYYKGKVYDIESAGSFCPFFLVHNCWLFPKGKARANVGVGILPGEKTPQYYLDQFIQNSPVLRDGSILEVNAGAVPVGGFLENVVANGFMVIGEAAHHVNPIHGGGIKEAIISGLLAADVAIKCLKKGDASQKALAEFNKVWWRKRGRKLRNVERVREVVERLNDDELNMLATCLNGEDYIELTRGNKLTVLAKILARKPRLIKLARHLWTKT